MRARVTQPPSPGAYRGLIRIAGSEKLQLPVQCEVVERIFASPPGLFASLQSDEPCPTFQFTLENRKGAGAQVKTITSSDGDRILVRPMEGDSSEETSTFEVRVVQERLFVGEIFVELAGSDHPQIVRVSLAVSWARAVNE